VPSRPTQLRSASEDDVRPAARSSSGMKAGLIGAGVAVGVLALGGGVAFLVTQVL
jgi:hypothetical protein